MYDKNQSSKDVQCNLYHANGHEEKLLQKHEERREGEENKKRRLEFLSFLYIRLDEKNKLPDIR